MTLRLSRFTDEGIATFAHWLRGTAARSVGELPDGLLTDPAFASPIAKAPEFGIAPLKDSYALGCFLVDLLQPLNARSISFDRPLWAWLAAAFFDQLCPRDEDGNRPIRREAAYIISDSRTYYRHLVRTPWYLVSTHGENCRFLLLPRPGDAAPLSRQRTLLDTLASRQFLISSPTLIAAANRLYADPYTGQPRRGLSASRGGSPARLALIANQLSLTYDIHTMPVERFLELLPEEFGPQRRMRAPRRAGSI